MDLKLEKPSHIFAVVLLVFSFILFFILPVYTFFLIQKSPNIMENIEISESSAILSQIILMVFFILVPFLWYFLVNKLKFKEIFTKIKLIKKDINKAFLLGVLAAAAVFFIIILIEIILINIGQNPSDLSNIPQIEEIFSPVTMFLIVSIQPIGEEIFFRGFLYEKIEGFKGGLYAIVITSLLFGIAHMEYGKIFPVIMPIIMGFVLGFLVYKTKNLYSAIFSHVVFNITSLSLAYFGQKILENLALKL